MADEYIKREDAINAVRKWAKEHVTIDLIKDIPAEDVAPVVRCKDCKHGNLNADTSTPNFYYCEYSLLYRNGNFYCAYGRRKDNE